MLQMNNLNVNFSAISCDAETKEQFATMNASYSGDSIYFNLTVEKDNEVINDDFAEFKAAVLKIVDEVK